MVGLMVAFAIGKFYSYTGQVVVLANGSCWCDSGVLQYDSFTPGLRVDGTQLAPFCVKVDSFTASYLSTGQPASYDAPLQYQSGDDLTSDTWRPYVLKVNSPLRTAGDRVYLINHGYAPQFTVTFPNGQSRTGVIQWKPDDPTTYLSEGATKFDPPGMTDPSELTKHQLAISGLFAPTGVMSDGILSSTNPAPHNPEVSAFVYQGDLGEQAGTGQSIFTVDQNMLAQGK